MNTTSQLSEAFQIAFEHPAGGVVGLVDDLLRLCPEQGLQLDWHADHCRVRSPASGSEEVLARPLRKSVFRAMLARVAALCNERSPNSVSPYGGEARLVVGRDTTVQVSFVNTSAEQRMELRPVQPDGDEPAERPTIKPSPVRE